jgi:hypothetical protein
VVLKFEIGFVVKCVVHSGPLGIDGNKLGKAIQK